MVGSRFRNFFIGNIEGSVLKNANFSFNVIGIQFFSLHRPYFCSFCLYQFQTMKLFCRHTRKSSLKVPFICSLTHLSCRAPTFVYISSFSSMLKRAYYTSFEYSQIILLAWRFLVFATFVCNGENQAYLGPATMTLTTPELSLGSQFWFDGTF